MGHSWYDMAQICKNGHLITAHCKSSPSHKEKYCSKCGVETITTCLYCSAEIRGCYQTLGVTSNVGIEIPLYCYSCGKPYPWTEEKIKAIKDFSKEMELSLEDKQIIEDNVTEIVVDTPKTQVSAVRIKKVLSRVGGAFADRLRNMIVDIASETAVKLIKGN